MRCGLARLMCLGSVALWAAATVTAAGAPAPGPGNPVTGNPVTGSPVAAVWKEHHLDFVYRGRTARYSCDGLRDKVRAMLLDLGARRDVKIVAIGCEGENRLRVNSALPSLNISFFAPALPDGTARALRVGDLSATDARFVEFTIASDTFRNMGIGDCELVQEFARQILPRLVTRRVRQKIACVPLQPGGSRFWVRGEILKTLPRAE